MNSLGRDGIWAHTDTFGTPASPACSVDAGFVLIAATSLGASFLLDETAFRVGCFRGRTVPIGGIDGVVHDLHFLVSLHSELRLDLTHLIVRQTGYLGHNGGWRPLLVALLTWFTNVSGENWYLLFWIHLTCLLLSLFYCPFSLLLFHCWGTFILFLFYFFLWRFLFLLLRNIYLFCL